MRSFHLRLSLPEPLFICAVSVPSSSSRGYAVDEKMVFPITLKWSLSPIPLDTVSRSSARFRYASPWKVGTCAVERPLTVDSDEYQAEEDQEVHFDGDVDFKESERRRKIGLANKGKAPWNVGRKHSEETRQRIRQRTIEALRDPKVRKKMAEHPRPHSDQIKAKIRSSLRRIWGERLKEKRLKEELFFTWWDNIAETAKTGLTDQDELDWDSFDKIKRELALQQLKRMAEKEAAKIIAKVKAVRAAQAKAEKLARLAQKRKEREERRKAREQQQQQKKAMPVKLNETKDECEVTQLKQRLEKIQRKKPVTIQVTGQSDATLSQTPHWEEMDLEIIRKEKSRNELSLADQIRAAKNKRAESNDPESFLAYNSSSQ